MNDDGSSLITERVYPRTKEHDTMDIESEGNAALNMENDLMMADESGEAMTLQPSVINAKATQMFTGGDGAPRRSGEGAVATAPTLWLIKLAKEAVFELFLHHRDEVQRAKCIAPTPPGPSSAYQSPTTG